jgi:hypothetical protein
VLQSRSDQLCQLRDEIGGTLRVLSRLVFDGILTLSSVKLE